VGGPGGCDPRRVDQLCAIQTVALARLAALEEVVEEGGTITEQDRGIGHQRLDAPALACDLLGVTDAGAAVRLEHAVRATARIPELLDALGAGLLDGYRAAVVSEELADAPGEVYAAVMGVVAPHLGGETAGVLRRRVQRVLGRVAPLGGHRQARQTPGHRRHQRQPRPSPCVGQSGGVGPGGGAVGARCTVQPGRCLIWSTS